MPLDWDEVLIYSMMKYKEVSIFLLFRIYVSQTEKTDLRKNINVLYMCMCLYRERTEPKRCSTRGDLHPHAQKKSVQALLIFLFLQFSGWGTVLQTCQSWSWWSFLPQPQWPTHNWASLCSSLATPGRGWHQTALSSDLRRGLSTRRGERTGQDRFNKNPSSHNKHGLFRHGKSAFWAVQVLKIKRCPHSAKGHFVSFSLVYFIIVPFQIDEKEHSKDEESKYGLCLHEAHLGEQMWVHTEPDLDKCQQSTWFRTTQRPQLWSYSCFLFWRTLYFPPQINTSEAFFSSLYLHTWEWDHSTSPCLPPNGKWWCRLPES